MVVTLEPTAPVDEGGPGRPGVSLPLFVGFGIVATGGPLALVALFVPQSVGALHSVGLVGLLSVAIFALPVAIWFRFSRTVSSSGGLFSFVEAAAGRRWALVQGAVWVVSYFLYLPYTIAYIVYDLLPVVFPGIGGLRPVLEIVLPLGVVALAFLRIRTGLVIVAGLALLQLGVLVALFASGVHLLGVAAGAFAVHGRSGPVLSAGADLSLLYVCTSLPLYLGGEVTGGARTVRRGLVAGFGLSAAFVVAGALVWATAGAGLLASPIPGVTLATATVSSGFGTVVGLGVVASVAGVVVAEYFALSRLLNVMAGRPLRRTTSLVAVGFVVSSLLSLIDPQAFYTELLKPSLVALWVSQIIVCAVYPLYARAGGRLRLLPVTLGAGGTAVMGFGLYEALRAVST